MQEIGEGETGVIMAMNPGGQQATVKLANQKSGEASDWYVRVIDTRHLRKVDTNGRLQARVENTTVPPSANSDEGKWNRWLAEPWKLVGLSSEFITRRYKKNMEDDRLRHTH